MNTTTTQDAEIVEALTAAIAEVLGSVPDGLDENTRLSEDLGLDSTSVLSLLMALEDALDMQVDPDTLEQRHLETFGSLAGYIAESR